MARRNKTSDLASNAQRRCHQGMVRPRPQNLAATVFVFEGTRKPYQTHVVYLDQASCYVDNPKWKHTATLDPAAWIEHLMNNPAERNEQIEGICSRPTMKPAMRDLWRTTANPSRNAHWLR